MTSTLVQQHLIEKELTKSSTMAWSNERLRFSCIDNIKLKQLWKIIALDSANSRKPPKIIINNFQQCIDQQQEQHTTISPNNNNNDNNSRNEDFADCLTNRDTLLSSEMSLLKFLAINALELSAPATPILLQQHQATDTTRPPGWMQLSGHPESIVPTSAGIVRKRIASPKDNEVIAYELISKETQTALIVPQYFGTQQFNGESFIELQDLLSGFKDPCVMDIKMGCRTFLESEVNNKTLRTDLYKKMVAVNAQAPTDAEHAAQAITKLRYMLFREEMSSSLTKGFRIEAMRLCGHAPLKDLKTCRTDDEISQIIEQFSSARKSVLKPLIKQLKHMRLIMEQSHFFNTHEIVGSSIFIVYDSERLGIWLIDFAKSRCIPTGLKITHRADWIPGNHEEGLLKGMDELICAFEQVYARIGGDKRCLQI